MLTVLFVETSLELVPRKIMRHPSVTRNAKREGKKPNEVLLDRSLHHHAMKSLDGAERRGRPDIIHFCLLEALGSPLNKEGVLGLFSHTVNDELITISPKLRLPRDCNRFRSLVEQLFAVGHVPPDEELPLLSIKKKQLGEFRAEINPSRTLALSSHGKMERLEDLCSRLANEKNPLVYIGAYPHGAMKVETLREADEVVSIHHEALEAWTVVSRFIYEYEKALHLM